VADAEVGADSGDVAAPGGDLGVAVDSTTQTVAPMPTIESVAPRVVSAAGGVTVTLTGTGFGADTALELRIGDEPAAELDVEVSDTSLRFVMPSRAPGIWTLRLSTGGWVIDLPAVLFVEAAELQYTGVVIDEAPDSSPSVEVRDALVFDVDRDGDGDLVVATSEGLAVYVNSGSGQLSLQMDKADGLLPARPGGRFDARALFAGDATGDGNPELFVCTNAGRDVWLQSSSGGLIDSPPLPARGGRCVAGAAGRFNEDEALDLVWLVQDDHGGDADATSTTTTTTAVLVLEGDGLGGFVWSEDVSPAKAGDYPIGEATGTGANFIRTTEDAASGSASGRLTYSLGTGGTAVFTLPTPTSTIGPLQLRARSDPPGAFRIRLTAAGAEPVDSAPLQVGANWKKLNVPAGDGPPMATPASVSIVVEGPAAGAIWIDDVVAGAGQAVELIEDFEDREPRFVFPVAEGVKAASGDLDADGRIDLVVGAGETVSVLSSKLGVPWAQLKPVEVGASTGMVLTDAFGDGTMDLALIGSGQDRLWIGDGFGGLSLFEAGGFPIDSSPGHDIVSADVDLDGIADLIIANAGDTDRLYLGGAGGPFYDLTPRLGLDTMASAVVAVGDLDGDHILDVVTLAADATSPPFVRLSRGY